MVFSSSFAFETALLPEAKIKPKAFRLATMVALIAVMSCFAGFHGASGASVPVALFGREELFTLDASNIYALKNSGFTTIILFVVDVESNGDLNYNGDHLIIQNGVWVGDTGWAGRLAALKAAPSSITRIEICTGGSGAQSWNNIKSLIASQGTGSSSILYKNFQVLKNTLGIDAIDNDDEVAFDSGSAAQFNNMITSLGMKNTLCPYNNTSYWKSVFQNSTIDQVYLQCYDGGAGNNPSTWNTLFGGGFKVIPGDWNQDSATTVQSKMTGWYNTTGLHGGFMWQLESIGDNNLATFAQAILYGPSFLAPAPGFNAVVSGNSAILNWIALPGSYVTGYNVKRATASGGPYTTIAPNISRPSYQDTSIVAATTYYYVVSAIDGVGEGPNSDELIISESYDTALPLLTSGTIIGTTGSFGGASNTRDKVFDNNINTFFDAPDSDGDWTGLDLGSDNIKTLTAIRYYPRATWAGRMTGGFFQGSNTADFSSGVTTLFTIPSTPVDGVFTTAAIPANVGSFRYFRYLSPSGGWCNVSEVKFYGVSIPTAPAGVTATMKDGTASLSWNAVTSALKYNVKRATVSGGPYTTVGANLTVATFQDGGLSAATTYYYVISALNQAGEGPYSAQATASDLYSQWLAQNGYTPGASDTDFGEDANHNGISNGVEYMDPAGLNVVAGMSNSIVTAVVRQDSLVTLSLWTSTDLASWTQVSFPTAADQSGVSAGFVRMQFQDSAGPFSVPKKFYRIEATR